LVLFLDKNLGNLCLIYFIFGVTSIFRIGAGVVYGFEMAPREMKRLVGTILVMGGVHIILTCLYYLYVSRNWHYLFVFYTTLIFIAFIMSYFIPESPAFLLSQNKQREALKTVNFIARWNSKP
jgi:uncharacterized membrane protein